MAGRAGPARIVMVSNVPFVVGTAVLAADLVERWRDMALELWVIAGALALLWLLLLGLCAVLTDPRKVDAGPATLDLGGPEPPAVVNLIARDWRLEHESLPATLLDLAARKHVGIEQVGDQTYVRSRPTPSGPSAGDTLTAYEDMVLDHVRGLARQGDDAMVPAQALTTGPGEASKGWWRNYRHAVERDARDRGLARKRWSPATHTLLVVAGLAVAVAVGLAFSALPPTDSSDGDDDNPLVGGFFTALVTSGGVIAAVESVGKRQRDTAAGRTAAARWLGLREMLAQDELFSEQPPAGVAVWDRHIAYGAALGVAHGAVSALPLGAESDTTAWSPVGGRWRVVHIRYPHYVPPGYGNHPAWALCGGLLQLAFTVSVLYGVLGVLLDWFYDLQQEGNEVASSQAVELGVLVGCGVVAAVVGFFALRAVWMTVVGLADLISGRHAVEGRVLRFRVRGQDNNKVTFVAVDDGTSDRVRAWLFRRSTHAPQGSTVRASVTKRLQHVRDLDVVAPGEEMNATRTYTHEMTASGE